MRATQENLAEVAAAAYPELATIREAAGGDAVFLVGGAVRDLLLERGRADLDLVVIGDAGALAERLGGGMPAGHERFGTAKAVVGDSRVDIATARSESYSRPGALPEVEPADTIEPDLARRDFRVNAMALPLQGERRLLDPYGGLVDLEVGSLRLLHSGSIADDPTRALRAARYAARLGFAVDAESLSLIRAADLDSVSAERREAELMRLAAEPTAIAGLRLLAEWGLVEPRIGGLALAAAVEEALESDRWPEPVSREKALLAAALGPPGAEVELAAASPRPAEGVELAGRADPVELVLARAMGALWIGRYLAAWRAIELEIDGSDLIAAGVPEGAAIGRGLDAALRRRLEGDVQGREEELAAALEAAREKGR